MPTAALHRVHVPAAGEERPLADGVAGFDACMRDRQNASRLDPVDNLHRYRTPVLLIRFSRASGIAARFCARQKGFLAEAFFIHDITG